MKLEFNVEDFIVEVENAMVKAMEYFHRESRPWVPYDTGNLYDNFTIEVERIKDSIVATGRWHGFSDESGKRIMGGYSGYFDYGQYQWNNHSTKSEWGDRAMSALKGNMEVIVRENIK